jgi:GNAT superfamily N-acetyltransferase
MPTIQQANIADIPALVDLLKVLFTQEEDFIPDAAVQKSGLQKIIEQPETGSILTLKQDDEIVGMVNLLYTISTALGGRVAILEDMVLHPNHRNKGHGSLLLKATIALAKQNNCLRITLLTDLKNNSAIKFYQQQGFVRSAMTPMRLML